MREQTQNTKTRLSFRFCDAFCFDSFSSGLFVIYSMIFFCHHWSLVYMQHSISIFNLYIWSFFYLGDLYYFLTFNNFSSFYFQISLCKLTKRYNSFSMPAAHSYYACVFGCPRRMAFFCAAFLFVLLYGRLQSCREIRRVPSQRAIQMILERAVSWRESFPANSFHFKQTK